MTSGGWGFRLALLLVVLWHVALATWLAASHFDAEYFYDERFNMENVRAILDSGSLEPANSWYHPITYLPQTAVLWGMTKAHAATGWDWLSVRTPTGSVSEAGYVAGRLVCILWGALAIWITGWLGARLFSPLVGLGAALAMGSSPWAVRGLVEIKPDSLLLATTMVALWWTLAASEQPTWARFARAGAGFGLSVAAKLNGLLFAPVLGLAAWLAEPKIPWRRRLAWVALAVGVGLGLYVVLTPDLRDTLFFFGRIQRHYERQGVATTRTQLALTIFGDIVDGEFHGSILGLFALAGLVGVAVVLSRRRPWGARERALALVFAYPAAYLLGYLALTSYHKANNLLQLLPFTALAAAWAASELVAALGRWLGARVGRWSARGATIAFAALCLWQGGGWTYAANVPTTSVVIARELDLRLPFLSPRIGYFEGPAAEVPSAVTRRKEFSLAFFSWLAVPDLRAVPTEELDLADCEVFLRRRLRSPGHEAYRARLARVEGGAAPQARARLFQARGPGLRLLFHPWEPYGGEVELQVSRGEGVGELRASLPADWLPGEVASIYFQLPAQLEVKRLIVAGRPLRVLLAADLKGRTEATSTRLRLPSSAAQVDLTLSAAAPDNPDDPLIVSAVRWRPMAPATATSR